MDGSVNSKKPPMKMGGFQCWWLYNSLAFLISSWISSSVGVRSWVRAYPPPMRMARPIPTGTPQALPMMMTEAMTRMRDMARKMVEALFLMFMVSV